MSASNSNEMRQAEKNRLIDQYRDETLDLTGAKRLRDRLLECLLIENTDAARTVADGVLLIGVNALIGRMGGRTNIPAFFSKRQQMLRSINASRKPAQC